MHKEINRYQQYRNFFGGFLLLSALTFVYISDSYKPNILIYSSPYAFKNFIISNQSVVGLQQNSAQIDIISPQDIHLQASGKIVAQNNSNLINFARGKNIKVIPAVVNMNFNTRKTTQFLQNPAAKKLAISNLLNYALANNLDGMQIDFERIKKSDFKLFVDFYCELAQAFHQNNLLISIALIPELINEKNIGFYQDINKHSNFVTIMAYNEHHGKSKPGPVSSAKTLEIIINRYLAVFPAAKISLGVPFYSGFWQINGKLRQGRNLVYKQVAKIAAKNQINWQWDAENRVKYAHFKIADSNKTGVIYFEEAQAFAAKIALAKKYHLHGISAWRLGQEDPRVWNYI